MAAAASASASSSAQKASGTCLARDRAWSAPNTTITAISATTNQRLSWSKMKLIA